jgi:pyocin large subunit-like protein
LLRTNGFEDIVKRFEHYMDHKQDFGNCTIAEYEEMADVFLTEVKRDDVMECTRRCGDRLRYDTRTGTFGILSKNAMIKTYFKPIPCSEVPAGVYKDCHGHADNITYFQMECRK